MTATAPGTETALTHVDVLIVGAGLSGIGAACHLETKVPGRTYAILESRDAIGGTWDLFRYPGIRSDSDMYTLGYSFRPWKAARSIADGPSILEYVRDTARDYGVEAKIRFNHRVVRSEWSSADARWTVTAERTDTGETVELTCSFLYSCTGYYRYDEGYSPQFPGADRFTGTLIHPQHWPADLDYDGKRVVVIGSGATAVTLVPAMAERAAHVTMLQRSPTYIVAMPGEDPLAKLLGRFLPPKTRYPVIRWKNVLLTMLSYQLSRRRPQLMKNVLRKGLQRQLPAGFDIDTHFSPRYDPWDQRLCLVPDGDLFKALGTGRASVVTDQIETFTESGIQLASGKHLDADVIVSATGLNMLALGGMDLVVDGKEVALGETVAYKGMMLSDVPNLAIAIGYTNASWTLKADLVSEYVCRLLAYLDEHGYDYVAPRWTEGALPANPFIDLNSGYVMRSIAKFPKQGNRAPWRLYQNYVRDVLLIKRGKIEDEALEFSRAVPADTPQRVSAA